MNFDKVNETKMLEGSWLRQGWSGGLGLGNGSFGPRKRTLLPLLDFPPLPPDEQLLMTFQFLAEVV